MRGAPVEERFLAETVADQEVLGGTGSVDHHGEHAVQLLQKADAVFAV